MNATTLAIHITDNRMFFLVVWAVYTADFFDDTTFFGEIFLVFFCMEKK